LLQFIETEDNKKKVAAARESVDEFFNDVELCGPRIVVDTPDANGESKLCQLFVPYQHSMKEFSNMMEDLVATPIQIKESSFLETMERSLHKRSNVGRLGKGNGMQDILKAKPGKTPKAEEQCKHADAGSTWTSDRLAQKKQDFCLGYKHLDLTSENIRNVAVHYLDEDIPPEFISNDKQMDSLSDQIRYRVTDSSCPAAPLFEAKDISIQQVAMDPLAVDKAWVAVVKLNTKDSNGYLQSELEYCKVREYLIGAKVEVKAYIVEDDECCNGLQDYEVCEKFECKSSKVLATNKKHYGKEIMLTGTKYKVDSWHKNTGRRRLLGRMGVKEGGGC
jgi:hypothetical protein